LWVARVLGAGFSVVVLAMLGVAPLAQALTPPRIYWTNYNGGAIGSANLDGTGVNQSFITGASFPVGLAVDGQHIYWANEGLATIGVANLDGTGVNQSFISTGASDLVGLAVDGQHIYWADDANPGTDRRGQPRRLRGQQHVHHGVDFCAGHGRR
jgi:virginiamycin B lyase